MEGIEQAIMHAARAGKLRGYVRKNGDGLTGLIRLADKESERATAHIAMMLGETAGVTAAASPASLDRRPHSA